MEENIASLVGWLRLSLETVSIVLVSVGAVVAVFLLVRALLTPQIVSFNRVRLTFGRALVLGLEFQLASDIMGTAISPSWDHLGKLGAIAVIRTFLNFFLTRELKEEEQELQAAARRSQAQAGKDAGRQPLSKSD
ncbi:MAG: DUF1622 domain-containing protein [Syntrophobacterales bacterium]|jgi:uncharacterized membrane protein